MQVASGTRVRAGGRQPPQPEGRIIPEPADGIANGPVGTLRAAVLVLARQIRLPRTTWPTGQFDRSDRADRDAVTCAAPAPRRLAVLT